MQLGSEPEELLKWLGPAIAAPARTMLAAIGMGRLPKGILVQRLPTATLLYLDGRKSLVDITSPKAAERDLRRLGRLLVLARDAEVRRALIAIEGRPEGGAPAWAWLCPQILHDALALANMSGEELLVRLDLARAQGRRVSTRLDFARESGSSVRSVDVTIRTVEDRLLTRVDLQQAVHVTCARSAACVAHGYGQQTIARGLVHGQARDVVSHPLVDARDYPIHSTAVVGNDLRAAIRMPISVLAPLPDRLARLFPHNPNTTRSAIAWG